MASGAHGMVTSVEQLIGRITVATERRQCETLGNPDVVIFVLGLPLPNTATNRELSQLKPIYNTILQDIRQKQSESMFLKPIIESNESSPEAAILLLYFLEFPGLVRTMRGDVSGLGQCNVNEKFDLVDIAEELSSNKALLSWSRCALTNCQKHHISVLASAVSLLASLDESRFVNKSKKSLRRLIRRVVFQGMSNEDGFAELRSDLARLLLSKTDLPAQVVANTMLMQVHILRTVYSEEEVMGFMEQATHKRVFEVALSRVRSSLGDDSQYQIFRTILGVSQSAHELYQSSQASFQEPKGEILRCDGEGCDNPPIDRCGRCKLVSYCSRDCQAKHWKLGHKKVCRKKPKAVSTSGIEAETERARLEKRPALLEQERFLSTLEGLVDYVIFMPTGTQDVAVCLSSRLDIATYQLARQRAFACDIHVMCNMITSARPDLHPVIRKQLHAEYGIDPLEAKTSPTVDFSPGVLTRASTAFNSGGSIGYIK